MGLFMRLGGGISEVLTDNSGGGVECVGCVDDMGGVGGGRGGAEGALEGGGGALDGGGIGGGARFDDDIRSMRGFGGGMSGSGGISIRGGLGG
jgi:hypothetical protein